MNIDPLTLTSDPVGVLLTRLNVHHSKDSALSVVQFISVACQLSPIPWFSLSHATPILPTTHFLAHDSDHQSPFQSCG